MAKKKINIILIIVVLGLWGTVGYRAINRQFSGGEMILEKENLHSNTPINQINKDTFKLEKINRDPFLNKQFQTAVVAAPIKAVFHNYTKPIKKAPVPTVPKSDPNLRWPTLTYYGYIGSKNEELVLLKIDSKVCKLKVNDPLNGLIVKKRYKDSIEVSFNTQTKMIRLK